MAVAQSRFRVPASLRNKRLAWVAGFLALAGVVWLVYGTGYVDYDLLYGLLWGHQIDHGVTPDFHAVHAPTPHPLVNALSILISPLGSGALVFWHVAGVLALAFLGVAAFRLGHELGVGLHRPAGRSWRDLRLGAGIRGARRRHQ